MESNTHGPGRALSVRSFTLDELTERPPPQAARPSVLRKIADFVKAALMAWAIMSLGAVAGIVAYYLHDSDDAPLLVAESRPAAASPETAAPPRERLAALVDAPESPWYTAPPSELTQALMLRAPTPVADPRIPRPRPEEPMTTGSIGPPAYDSYSVAPARRRSLDPCTALRNLGAPFLFGNRCGHYTRVYAPPPRRYERDYAAPPPPREYIPQPYQPPLVIE